MSNRSRYNVCVRVSAWSWALASVAHGQQLCPVTLTASDAAVEDELGNSVALDGNAALFGAWRDDDRGPEAGAAYVFRRVGTTWLQEQKLVASDGAGWDYFGFSVALDDTVAVVGAPYDLAGAIPLGAVYVYRHNGSEWAQEQKLAPLDGHHRFGYSVAIDGDTIAVGAPADATSFQDRGAVYVYHRQGGQWELQQRLLATDGAPGDRLGSTVDLEGEMILAGANADDDRGNLSGSAYVFRYNGSTWEQEAKLTAADGAQNDQFGQSAAISSGVALIGSLRADAGAPDSGAAYVFRSYGSSWLQEAKLVPSDPTQFLSFGGAVDLAGNTAIVGSWIYGAGRVYTFRYDEAGWSQAQRVRNPLDDPPAQDGFGWSLALSGDDALIGARWADAACPGNTVCNSGAAYLITGLSEPDCNANAVPDVCDPDLDCNANGVQDICDVATGASADCNGNEVPDECLVDEGDCNVNGVPDECDVTQGSSDDCNENGAPDECDLSSGASQDCNASGVPDECELDCNDNGLHDACDLYAGTSEDCNDNNIPDECEVDCNDNGLHDSCDIAAGTSADCTGNGTPDECEPDCNSNAVPDSCDIGAGSSADCNENEVPDECDLTATNDCNRNGVPDECEPDCNRNEVPDACDLAAGSSQDCSVNGVPDECEPDCNQNGLTDVCEIADGLSPDCDNNGVPDECSWAQQARVSAFDSDDIAALRQAFEEGTWPPMRSVFAPDGFEEFGESVSISANRLLVGASNDENFGDPYFSAGFGAAYVFRHEDGGTPLDPLDDAWLPEAKLTASDAERNQQFGLSLSLSGDRAAIGAEEADTVNGQGQPVFSPGAVYVFTRQGDLWTETAKLTATDAQHFDAFGRAVDLEGDDLVAGNPSDDDGGLNSGSAYVLHWNGSAWVQAAKLTASDPAPGREFGKAVSISGNVAAVAATGGVYVFRRTGTTWSQEAKLVPGGSSIALDGDTLLVGIDAVGSNPPASVFRWNGSAWVLEASLIAVSVESGAAFGSSVAVEGNLAVIGSRTKDAAFPDSGAAYVFRRRGTAWSEEAVLLANVASEGDELGKAVSIGGGRVAVGAPGEHEGGDHAGAAYIFVDLDENTNGLPDPCESACPTEVPATPAGRWLYWTDIDDHGIRRSRSDGAMAELLPVQTSSPAGLTIDGAGGRMYWTESQTGWIKRAYLDGSCVESLVQVTNEVGQPIQLRGIALDIGAGKLYWAAYSRDMIQRANQDGSGVETLIDHQEAARGFVGLTLDAAAGRMYWAESTGHRIMQADLDGTSPEVVVSSGPSGAEGPYYLALDHSAGMLYWTEFETGRVRRAPVDGGAIETLFTNTDGPPVGLTLDLANQRLSWTLLDGKIRQADLGGSGVGDVVTSLTSPWGLAVSPSSDGFAIPDYAAMVGCLMGPGATPSPESPWTAESCLGTYDFDADQDVDLMDVALMTRWFQGF